MHRTTLLTLLLSSLIANLGATEDWGPASGSVESGSSKQGRPYVPTPNAIKAVAVSPDGRLVACGGNAGFVDLWSESAGPEGGQTAGVWRRVQRIEVRAAVNCMSFSPDGQGLAFGCADSSARIWHTVGHRFESLATIDNTHGAVLSLAYSPDGTLLAFGTEGASYVFVCNARTGGREGVYRDPSNGVESICFSPDGRQLLEAGEGLNLWKLTDLGLPSSPPKVTMELRSTQNNRLALRFGGDWIKGAACSPDGRQVASAGRLPGDSGAPMSLALYDAGTGQLQRIIAKNLSEFRRVSYSPSGQQIAACSLDGNVRIWDVATGQLQYTFHTQGGAVHAIAFFPQGLLVAAGGDNGALNIWNIGTGKVATTLRPPEEQPLRTARRGYELTNELPWPSTLRLSRL